MNKLRPSRLCGRTRRNQNVVSIRAICGYIGVQVVKKCHRTRNKPFPNGRSHGRVHISHCLDYKMQHFTPPLAVDYHGFLAQHWVLVPRIHANQISREKNVLENEKTLGMRVIVRWPQGTPSYKNRFQADSVQWGQGKFSNGRGKKGAKKRKEQGEEPVLYVSSHHFFFARLRPSLCLRRWPQVSRFYFVIKFSGRKQGYNTNETFPVFIYLFSFLSLIRGFPGAIEGWEIKLTRTQLNFVVLCPCFSWRLKLLSLPPSSDVLRGSSRVPAPLGQERVTNPYFYDGVS